MISKFVMHNIRGQVDLARPSDRAVLNTHLSENFRITELRKNPCIRGVNQSRGVHDP